MILLSFPELVKGERQESQEINRSINTMMTQLSNNSSNQSEHIPRGEKSWLKTIKTIVSSNILTSGPMRNSKTSASLNNRTKRLPSEGIIIIDYHFNISFFPDCVPNFGRINPGLDQVAEMGPRDQGFHSSRQYCEVV